MIATDDPVWAFLSALQPHVRARLNRSQTLVALIHRAVNHGWTPQALAAEANRDQTGVANPGGLVMFRLEHCAQHAPAAKTTTRIVPFCGHCDHGLVYSEPDDPKQDVTATKCPCRTTEATPCP